MQGFELTRAKRDLYVGVLRSRAFPVQIIWEADPASRSPPSVRSLAEPPAWTTSTGYPANISCRKDQSPALAELITAQAGRDVTPEPGRLAKVESAESGISMPRCASYRGVLEAQCGAFLADYPPWMKQSGYAGVVVGSANLVH